MRSLVQLGKELKAEVAVDAMMMMVAPTKKQKAGMTAVTASGTLLGSIATFFAGNADQFTSQAQNLTRSIMSVIMGVSTGLFFVFLAINLIKYAISGDPGTAREAKTNIKKLLIGWVAINSIGFIAKAVVDLTSGSGDNGGAGQTGERM